MPRGRPPRGEDVRGWYASENAMIVVVTGAARGCGPALVTRSRFRPLGAMPCATCPSEANSGRVVANGNRRSQRVVLSLCLPQVETKLLELFDAVPGSLNDRREIRKGDRRRGRRIQLRALTPFTADLQISRSDFRRPLKGWPTSAGVTAIMVNGAAGKDAALSRDEGPSQIAEALAAMGDRTPIIAAVREQRGDPDLETLARAAAAAGASALTVMPPPNKADLERGDFPAGSSDGALGSALACGQAHAGSAR